MIKNTSDSINAICGLCGFDDHSYFQKPLKKPTVAVPEILESRIYGTISHRFIRLSCRHYIFLFIGLQYNYYQTTGVSFYPNGTSFAFVLILV